MLDLVLLDYMLGRRYTGKDECADRNVDGALVLDKRVGWGMASKDWDLVWVEKRIDSLLSILAAYSY